MEPSLDIAIDAHDRDESRAVQTLFGGAGVSLGDGVEDGDLDGVVDGVSVLDGVSVQDGVSELVGVMLGVAETAALEPPAYGLLSFCRSVEVVLCGFRGVPPHPRDQKYTKGTQTRETVHDAARPPQKGSVASTKGAPVTVSVPATPPPAASPPSATA